MGDDSHLYRDATEKVVSLGAWLIPRSFAAARWEIPFSCRSRERQREKSELITHLNFNWLQNSRYSINARIQKVKCIFSQSYGF